MNPADIEILKRALEKEKKARKEAEKILEEKSRNLFLISKEFKLTNLKLQQLLEEKSSQLQGIFKNINDAYIVVDLLGNVLKMNDVAEVFFGYNLNKENLNISKLIYSDDKVYSEKSHKTFLKKGSFTNYTARIVTKKNHIKWVQLNATLVYDKDKNPIAAQGIVRDITKLKELQLQKESILKELRDSNNHLEEYAHIVSHDLKSPLRSIDALVSWIKTDNKDKLDNATLKNFELIEETLVTMDTLISNILEYSSSGIVTNELKDIKLNLLVEELKKILFIPKHITVKILTKLPVVKGDETKLKQLFQNLISNAVKFIDKETGIIEVDFKENNTFYEFSVKDNGIGIEEKYSEKVFQIFQTLKKNKESTGIGLSIVKKIVNLYQGDIWFESKPKIGTKFIFTLKK